MSLELRPSSWWRTGRSLLVAPALAALALAFVSGVTTSVAASAPGNAQTKTLTVLVTNDDGVGAPGIDAVVQGLRSLPKTKVVVVAPLINQSGTGGKTTPGPLTVTSTTTASGYPAHAVAGYPAEAGTLATSQLVRRRDRKRYCW